MRGGEQQRRRTGVEDPTGGADDAPRVGRPDQPGAGREVVEVVGDAAPRGEHVLDVARVQGAVPARADLQREAPVRAPRVLDVGAENLLRDHEVGVLHAPEEDDGAGGVAGGEVLQRVEVVVAVGVAHEELAQVVVAQRETRAQLVVPRDEGEPLLDLELPLVVGDRQRPGLSERAERRVVDREMGLQRTFGQVRAAIEVVVGVLDAELVDPALAGDRDDRAHRGVALDEPPRFLPDEIRHPRVVRVVVAQRERVPVGRPVVQLAEQDQVVGLPEKTPARGAAALGIGGGDPVVVRQIPGHQLGEGGADRIVLPASPDVPEEGLALGGLVVGDEEVGAVAADRTAERCAPVVTAELVHLVPRIVGRHAARGVERRPRQPGRQLVVAQEEDAGAGQLVGAALRDHVHGAAAGAAGLGGVAARDHLELLDGFLRHQGAAALPRQPAPPETEEGALRVRAVDGESRVHGALPAQRDPPPRVHLDRRLQEGEAHEVAARDRQVGDLVLGHVPGDPGPPHFEQRRLPGDHDRLFDRGQAQPQVHLEALPDEQADALPPDGAKAGQRRHQVVHARWARRAGRRSRPDS